MGRKLGKKARKQQIIDNLKHTIEMGIDIEVKYTLKELNNYNLTHILKIIC